MDRAAISAQTLSTSPATPRPSTAPPPARPHTQPTACRPYPSRPCAATGSRPLQRPPRPRCYRWVLTDCAAHPEARCVAIQATHSVGTPVAPLGSPHLRPWRPREPPEKRARHSPRCALACRRGCWAPAAEARRGPEQGQRAVLSWGRGRGPSCPASRRSKLPGASSI